VQRLAVLEVLLNVPREDLSVGKPRHEDRGREHSQAVYRSLLLNFVDLLQLLAIRTHRPGLDEAVLTR
jgi:hypothetical protein